LLATALSPARMAFPAIMFTCNKATLECGWLLQALFPAGSSSMPVAGTTKAPTASSGGTPAPRPRLPLQSDATTHPQLSLLIHITMKLAQVTVVGTAAAARRLGAGSRHGAQAQAPGSGGTGTEKPGLVPEWPNSFGCGTAHGIDPWWPLPTALVGHPWEERRMIGQSIL